MLRKDVSRQTRVARHELCGSIEFRSTMNAGGIPSWAGIVMVSPAHHSDNRGEITHCLAGYMLPAVELLDTFF